MSTNVNKMAKKMSPGVELHLSNRDTSGPAPPRIQLGLLYSPSHTQQATFTRQAPPVLALNRAAACFTGMFFLHKLLRTLWTVLHTMSDRDVSPGLPGTRPGFLGYANEFTYYPERDTRVRSSPRARGVLGGQLLVILTRSPPPRPRCIYKLFS
jgi:hypothetical protein